MMRNVVLPREVVEQLRNFLAQIARAEYYSHVTDEFANQQAEPFCVALDAALDEPAPFMRCEDDALVTGSGTTYYSITSVDDDQFGRIIHVYEDDVHSGCHECIGDDADAVRALALALLEITER